MQDHLKGLNSAQKEASIHTNGPILIIAGAGAGKTKTITHRIINLIKNGVLPEKILAVTFTNKAAKEMKERIVAEIEKNAKGQDTIPFVSTFHSLGVFIIKENAKILGLTKYFTILDDGDSNSIIKEALKELNIDPKQYEPRKIKNIISREKGKFKHYNDYQEESSGASYLSKIVSQVWKIYEEKKSKENSLDFDDLLLKSTKLLKDNEEIRRKYQDKWEYIHIDEYQDTNEVQYLMSKLLSEKNKNICVVGDADQNIYSWRGANLKNILSFEKDYPNAKIVTLEENYRSTKNILEAANEIIKKNKYRPDKNLFTKNEIGEKISIYEANDEGDEAEFVATKTLEIIDTSGEKILSKSIAVLYRANFQSRVLEESMLRYNVPYQVLGIKFFERKEIKDTLAYLRAALNPESLSDIKRIINFPARGLGKATLLKLFSGEKDTLPIKAQIKINSFYKTLEEISEKIKTEKASDVIKFAVKKSGIESELSSGTEEEIERLENIKELATLALKYDNLTEGSGIEKLLEDASLASDQDSIMIAESAKKPSASKNNNIIKLMTVHAAKGLEFDYVFITGLEDGLFPHQKMGDSSAVEDSEEERRLFYVALTRAREKLFLSYADYRTIFGSRQINAPSEFLGDIPADILEKEGEERVKTIYI
jgi:DNA helicase-2/ATP-dependent DNA helicase PcrA